YINCNEAKQKKIERDINKILINRSLYFVVCIENENELYILEFIHFMAQLLDTFFTNVCELDLLFNFHFLYYFFDNIILGGYIYEVNKNIILDKISKIKKVI
ncbi:clathrin coat assembly protein AP17, partial [Plasmodium cynomolgi strain B]